MSRRQLMPLSITFESYIGDDEDVLCEADLEPAEPDVGLTEGAILTSCKDASGRERIAELSSHERQTLEDRALDELERSRRRHDDYMDARDEDAWEARHG